MDESSEALPLTVAEARVLGCLIEKQATTPDQYPLTVNAVQAAANQKTARDPVLSLDAGTVHHALRQLDRKGLAQQVFSSRAERYGHRADAGLGLTRAQVALLGLLLLRGPQTVHELLARSERLHGFADADELRHHLERLAQHPQALVAVVPRAPGQREERFVHQLCGAVDVATMADASLPAPPQPTEATGLEARVEALEAALEDLRAQLAQVLDDRR